MLPSFRLSTERQVHVVDHSKCYVEWKVEAIVDPDSAAFAEKLQERLNALTQSEYSISQTFVRQPDNGFIIMAQKVHHVHSAEQVEGEEVKVPN